MSSAAEILVIIVSVVLSVFLIVGIILGVYLIKLSAEIRRIAKTAQETVDSIGDTVKGVSHLVSPVFIADLIRRQIKKFTSSSKRGK